MNLLKADVNIIKFNNNTNLHYVCNSINNLRKV